MDMTQKVTQRGERDRYLTGKGGVGLVMFHLARRKIEFAVASDHCPFGDIWAEINGQKVGIEVKTSRKGTEWHINRRQIGSAEFYCLVDMDTASCYVLTCAEMDVAAKAATSIYRDIAIVSVRSLPKDGFNDYARLTGKAERRPKVKLKYNSTRRVKHVLKNGEMREYVYPGADAPRLRVA